MRYASSLLSCALVVLGLSLCGQVRADGAPGPDAEALFRGGKELLARGDYAAACPLLAASFRAEPATGSLLALAMCHEREGKLASAHREYQEVVKRSQAESSPGRERAAREKAVALAPTLSSVTIRFANERDLVNGATVKLDGVPLAERSIGTAIARDGGTIVIDVACPGKIAVHTSLTLAPSRDNQRVTISPLVDVPLPPPPVVAATPKASVQPVKQPVAVRHDSSGTSLTAVQWTGAGLMGAGLVTLGVGGRYVLRALHMSHVSDVECLGDVCPPGARKQRQDARAAGDTATILLATGAGVFSAGLITYLLGRRERSPYASSNRLSSVGASLGASAWASPRAAGACLGGSF